MATVKKYISKNGDISYNIRAYAGYDRYGRQIEKRMTWRPGQGMSEKAIKKELERQIVLFEEKIRQNKVFDTNTTFVHFMFYLISSLYYHTSKYFNNNNA